MGASSSRGISVHLSKGGITPTESVISAVTAAKPAVVTVASTTGIVKGDVVQVTGTNIAKIDGKYFIAGTVVGAATNTVELIGADLTGATIPAIPGTAKLRHWPASDFVTLCLSSLAINPETPGTVSVGTFCDPSASLAAVVTSAGTLTLGGYIDDKDLGYAELLLAEIDNTERVLDITLPGTLGHIVAPITVASVVYDLPIDGGLAFTATASLGSKPVHRF